MRGRIQIPSYRRGHCALHLVCNKNVTIFQLFVCVSCLCIQRYRVTQQLQQLTGSACVVLCCVVGKCARLFEWFSAPFCCCCLLRIKKRSSFPYCAAALTYCNCTYSSFLFIPPPWEFCKPITRLGLVHDAFIYICCTVCWSHSLSNDETGRGETSYVYRYHSVAEKLVIPPTLMRIIRWKTSRIFIYFIRK